MIITNTDTGFRPLYGANIPDENVMDIYNTLRFTFEQSHPNNMVDASDAYILTVFPFKRGDKIPEDYCVVNYETGLIRGKPALRKLGGGKEILLVD